VALLGLNGSGKRPHALRDRRGLLEATKGAGRHLAEQVRDRGAPGGGSASRTTRACRPTEPTNNNLVSRPAFTARRTGAVRRRGLVLTRLGLVKPASRPAVDVQPGLAQKVSIASRFVRRSRCCWWTSRSWASMPGPAGTLLQQLVRGGRQPGGGAGVEPPGRVRENGRARCIGLAGRASSSNDRKARRRGGGRNPAADFGWLGLAARTLLQRVQLRGVLQTKVARRRGPAPTAREGERGPGIPIDGDVERGIPGLPPKGDSVRASEGFLIPLSLVWWGQHTHDWRPIAVYIIKG